MVKNKKIIYLVFLIVVVVSYKTILHKKSVNEYFLFTNGTIITMEDNQPTAEAVYVENGFILDVGLTNDLKENIHPNTVIVDLQGNTLLPGFIDSHTHPLISTFLYDAVDLSGFKHSSKEDVWNYFKKQVAQYNPGEWIFCKGFDQALIPNLEPPHISFLDSIAPHNPVIIASQSLHSYWGNSLAFKMVSIDKSTPDPSISSYYEKDQNGELTGYITEQIAFKPFKNTIINAFGKSALKSNSVAVLKDYARNGNTSITSLGLTTSDKNILRLYEHLSSKKISLINHLLSFIGVLPEKLPTIRHFVFIRYDASHLLPNSVKNGDDFFKILGIKLWYDGSPYTGSMYINEPYLNSNFVKDKLHIPHNHTGKPLLTKNQLIDYLTNYHNDSWQIAIHSQGDIAIQELLESFKQIINNDYDSRHRFEHCLLLQNESMRNMAALGINPSFHINHLFYYGKVLNEQILGKERTNQMLPIKTADENGLIYTLHSDQPMFPSEPMSLLHTAVNRRTKEGLLIGTHNAISVGQGLKALTLNAAWQIKMEQKIGSIKKGKYADFVILDKNPLKSPPSELRNINVLQTIVNGRTIFTTDWNKINK